MIVYFKYDEGNAFLLNGTPYTGFFNISGNKAFTGKTFTVNSEELQPTETFLSEFYLNQMEFDVTADSIEFASPYVLNSFDILNKNQLEQAFNQINSNNLLAFKNLIVQNPDLFSVNRTNTHFYGLSSTDADARNDDVPNGKNVYTHIDPFSYDRNWYFMDSIISGDFIVDMNDNFLYFCTDGSNQYTLSGSFDNFSVLTLMNSEPSNTFYIKQDTVDNKIFMVSLSSIKIYDLQNYATCQTLDLLDEILVDIDPNYTNSIKIGKNIRTEANSNTLFLNNKYSSEIFSQISFETLGITDIISIDIRDVDDYTLILTKTDDIYYLVSFDPFNVNNTLLKQEIEFVDGSSSVLFSSLDSNVFYIITDTIIQGRLISNPKFPFGYSKSSTYFYLKDYIYGTTDERYNRIPIKWNSNSMPSNSFNNILFRLTTTNDKQYLMTHNIGRLYVSSFDVSQNYLNAVPLNIEKSYNGTRCSESSFGLYFNTTISNLIKDTLRLRSLASEKYTVTPTEVVKYTISDLDFEIINLYLNGNESFNVVSIQRILTLINNIQNELISRT